MPYKDTVITLNKEDIKYQTFVLNNSSNKTINDYRNSQQFLTSANAGR